MSQITLSLDSFAKRGTKQLIVAGFHRVGICPFDRTAIQAVSLDEYKAGVDQTQDVNEDQSPDQNDDSNEQTVDNAIEDQIGENLDLSRPFTESEEELFQTRYKNGYDLFTDPNCLVATASSSSSSIITRACTCQPI